MAQRLRGRSGYDKELPFMPTIHRDRMEEPYHRLKPARIFTCSMGDLFDPLVPRDWIEDIFQVMDGCSRHTFQLLTKRYYGLLSFHYPQNLWLGVTQDCLSTDPDAIRALKLTDARVKFVSFEPLLGPMPRDDGADVSMLLYGIDWVIIGAQTGIGAKQPRKEWIASILLEASEYEIPIFVKNNVHWIGERPQDYPKEI